MRRFKDSYRRLQTELTFINFYRFSYEKPKIKQKVLKNQVSEHIQVNKSKIKDDGN